MSNYKCRIVTSRGVQPLFLLLRTRKVDLNLYLVLVAFFGVCGGYHEQKFAMEPQDQVSYCYFLYSSLFQLLRKES